MEKNEIRKHADLMTDLIAEKDRDFHEFCIHIGKKKLGKIHDMITDYMAYRMCGMERPWMRVKANELSPLVIGSARRSCYNTGENCPSGGKLPKAGECSFCEHYR